jgi:hypothetical protein
MPFPQKVWDKACCTYRLSCCGITYHMDNTLGTISCCIIMFNRSSKMNSRNFHIMCDNICVCDVWSSVHAYFLTVKDNLCNCSGTKNNPTNAHKLQRTQSTSFQWAIIAHKYVPCKFNTLKVLSTFQ